MHVALIDDDPAVLDSLALYLKRQAIAVTCFDTADAFIATGQNLPFDCVVADVRMPGLSGIDLVRRFGEEGSAMPIILITGHGDIDMAVAAIKLGAFDFIEKPFDESRLLESIRSATSDASARQRTAAGLAEKRARLESLTGRQRQVLDLAVAGLSNKQIAERLGISFRTVENHRAWMMERMGARNLAELVRMHMMLNGAHHQ
ncbi:MAG TPA: response regulator [Pseudolabrys sp.]|nr:response regulator [Pseudolabrys sp.]